MIHLFPRSFVRFTGRQGRVPARTGVLLLLTCAILAGHAELNAQPWTLRYSLPPGSSYQFKRIEKTSAVSQTHTGLNAEINRTTEAFITVSGENEANGNIVWIFEQDTALVDDKSTAPPGNAELPDLDNLLTRRPVRLTMTARGVLRGTEPLKPITAGRGMPPSVTDASVSRQAMIFPVLPDRPLEPGMQWTETAADTTTPTQRSAELGTGQGLRMTRTTTTYSVDTIEAVAGHRCLRISWRGSTMVESKMLFTEREFFTEEETTVAGMLWFSIDTGIPVKLTLRSDRNMTTAAFAHEMAIIPSSMSKDITLQLLPR